MIRVVFDMFLTDLIVSLCYDKGCTVSSEASKCNCLMEALLRQTKPLIQGQQTVVLTKALQKKHKEKNNNSPPCTVRSGYTVYVGYKHQL